METLGKLDAQQWSPARMMQLQRTLGNKAVQGMVQRMGTELSVVQRAGGSGTAPATLSPEQQQRKAEMDTERDAKVASFVDASFTDIQDKVTKNLDTYLTSDSKADSIRKNVKAKVLSEIAASMTAGTADQRKDALKYAQESAEGIMVAKLKSYAAEVAQDQLTDARKNGLAAEANKAYDTVAPSLNDAAFEKQKTKAAAEAQKKLNVLAKTVITETIRDAKVVITAKFAPAAVPGGASGFDRIDVGTVGTDELDKRMTLDGSLVDQTVIRQETAGGQTRDIKDMENIYKTMLFDPLKTAVLSKLGVGRRAFRRSKELNDYRQVLKDAARAKVNEQINAEVDDRQAGGNPIAPTTAPMKAEYLKMASKVMAFQESKKLVDDVMGDEADIIVEQLVPKDSTIDQLTTVAKSSAYEVARKDRTAADKIQAAGIGAAKTQAEKLLKENKEKAVLEARKLTKGTKKTATEAATVPDAAKTGQVKAAVEDDTKTRTMAKTVIDKSVEANDLNSGFNKVGKLIDISTPNAGDSSSMSIELKIPFASASGGGQGYFLFGFEGEAEREADDLTVNTQITFGAGFTTFGFDANFRLGLFLEGKGKDTDSVMNLLSYGLYREMSGISSGAAAHFWGRGGKSGDTKLVEAEKWAMMVEEQNMDDEAEVKVGLLTKIAMEANVGVAGFSGELARKQLSSYKKKIIEQLGKDSGGNLLTAAERVAGNSIGKGEIQKIYEAAAEVEVKFGKDQVAFGVEGSMTRINKKTRELSLALSASIPSQFGEESGDFTKYAAKIVTAAVGGGKNISQLFKKAVATEPDRAARAGGTALDLGSDALFTGNYFDSIGASFAEKIQGDETINDTMRSWLPGQDSGASAIEQANKIALSNSLKLSAEFKRKYDETGTPSDWEISIEASQVKSQEVDAEIIKVAVEKSKRLGKLEFAKGKTAKMELFGFERGGDAAPTTP
ncbi:hypothetical protein ACFFNY_21395 [Paenibacillus hodogayensis]|uniref:Uncharacterized protein n=1 Tax=Paenibacillus hodogayensis TaxID=279208 RepID=A0ABV5W1L3_9BACL